MAPMVIKHRDDHCTNETMRELSQAAALHFAESSRKQHTCTDERGRFRITRKSKPVAMILRFMKTTYVAESNSASNELNELPNQKLQTRVHVGQAVERQGVHYKVEQRGR